MAELSRQRSKELFEEAKTMFPGGVHSPVRAFKSVDGPPLFIDRGEGSHIIDVDGNRYIDFCCSWGPLIHGHNHPTIREAIQNVLLKGTSFGAPSQLGNELGKLILGRHKQIEKIRFVSSGTEAVMSAIRLARAYTKKNKIIKFEGCYHGHVDSLLVKAGSGLATFGITTSAGIPQSYIEDTVVLPLADISALESALIKHEGKIACIIIEPIPANNGLLIQDSEYLVKLRDLCTNYGILLIFDEVISGFRVGFEGAAGHYGIKPDIMTFGKIIGGGLPVGAYASSHEIMSIVAPDGPMYQAGTLSANPIAMAAGKATLDLLTDGVNYDQLAASTSSFAEEINEKMNAWNLPAQVVHIGSIFWISFTKERIMRADQISESSTGYFKTLFSYLLQNGIYLGPSAYEVGFISTAHSESTLSNAAEIIAQGLKKTFDN